MSYRIGKKSSSQLVKVELNEFGDYVIINTGDASFAKRYGDLLKWMEEKDDHLSEVAENMEKKYKDSPMITTDEDGNAEIDAEQFSEFVKIKTEFYRDAEEKISALFGQDVLKKYFRAFYEINPEFVPDEECIMDFLEEISPVLEKIYSQRFDRINQKYSKDRKFGMKSAVEAGKGQ